MNLAWAERIRARIDAAQHILLIAHVDPDGDAIGSLLGLGSLLQDLGKDVTLACQDPVPDIYQWLPGSSQVVQQPGPSSPAPIPSVHSRPAPEGEGTGDAPQAPKHELVISLDCSDARRLGTILGPELASLPLINIDHHVTNTFFGTVNWVNPSSVATSQMVLTLADALGWTLTQPVAVCLLTGVVTDTRGFRTANVDAEALGSAVRLVGAGAPLGDIARRTLDQRPLASIRLWGEAIEHLHLEDGILWTEVTRSMVQRWGVSEDGSTGLTNFLAGVREAQVIAVFSERGGGVVDVGLRSAPGYDVAQVALRLGGGGHPQAAGCTFQGSLAEARERVLDEVRRSLAGPTAPASMPFTAPGAHELEIRRERGKDGPNA